MSKRVAVLAVNPVNGFGLFQYLEAFYENKIEYKVYAVSDTVDIRTNSGIAIKTDDTIAHLKGHSDDFDALVFSCGDAVPVFAEHASEEYNVVWLDVIREFAQADKLMIGHCAAALMFEIAGITKGKRLAVHPLAKPAIQHGVATDEPYEIDGKFYTAQCEHTLPALLPSLLEILK